jgi:hypothetical protein
MKFRRGSWLSTKLGIREETVLSLLRQWKAVMEIDDRSASRGERVEETPEPFRHMLLEHLSAKEPVSLLVYGPSFSTMDVNFPETVPASPTCAFLRWDLDLMRVGGRIQ